MIAFWLLAALALAAAAAAIAVPLLRHRRRREAADPVGVYRARYAELERERARGAVDEATFAEAVAELEAELLAQPESGEAAPSERAPSRPLVAAVAGAVVGVALAAYLGGGRPDQTGPSAAAALGPERVQALQAMAPDARIERLNAVVEQSPDSARAWTLLARAYRQAERYGDAVAAYDRARRAGADSARVLARQGEARLLANGRRFTDTVEDLLDDALARDANNALALMLAGHAALARGDTDTAVDHWQRLADNLPDGSDNQAMIERLIAHARGDADTAAERSASAEPTGESAGTGDGPRLSVRVGLDDTLAGAVAATTAVFIFARAAGADTGPPLAVARTTVEALPTTVTLTNADAMMPSANLASAERVTLTARASTNGDVSPSPGDLEGQSPTVDVDHEPTIEITIDRQIE